MTPHQSYQALLCRTPAQAAMMECQVISLLCNQNTTAALEQLSRLPERSRVFAHKTNTGETPEDLDLLWSADKCTANADRHSQTRTLAVSRRDATARCIYKHTFPHTMQRKSHRTASELVHMSTVSLHSHVGGPRKVCREEQRTLTGSACLAVFLLAKHSRTSFLASAS